MRTKSGLTYNKYDEYWILSNIFKGYSTREICYAIGKKYEKSTGCSIYSILYKYKLKIKINKNKRIYANFFDHYWVFRQYLLGNNIIDIEKASEYDYSTILKILKANNIHIFRRWNYGIAEIARELGVSRQRVHQKVKKCQSPYINYQKHRKETNVS